MHITWPGNLDDVCSDINRYSKESHKSKSPQPEYYTIDSLREQTLRVLKFRIPDKRNILGRSLISVKISRIQKILNSLPCLLLYPRYSPGINSNIPLQVHFDWDACFFPLFIIREASQMWLNHHAKGLQETYGLQEVDQIYSEYIIKTACTFISWSFIFQTVDHIQSTKRYLQF